MAILAIILIHTGPVQESLVRRALLAARPLEITAESIRFNLFNGQAEIRNLSIRARESDPPFVSVKDATVGWDYRALTRGLDAITGIRAKGVTVDIEIAPATGKLNLPETSDGGTTVKGMPRFIDLQDVSLVYVNGPLAICVPGAQLALKDNNWRLTSNQPTSVSMSGFSAALERIDYRGTLQGFSLESLTAQGHIDSSRLQIAEVGRVDASADFEFNGAQNRLNFSGLDARAKQGTVKGSGSLSIADEQSDADLTASSDGITAKATLRWPGVDALQAVGRAEVNAARKDVRGRATVDLQKDFVRVNTAGIVAYDATVRGAASMSRRTLVLAGKLNGDYPVLQGNVSFDANLAGTAKKPQAAITAHSDNLHLGQLEGVSLSAQADATLEKIHINEAVVTWQEQIANASGDVLLTGPTPQLDITATANDLSASRFLEGLNLNVPADGRMSLTAHATGDAKDPNVEANFSAQDLIAYGEKFGTFRANATYENSVATVTEFHLEKPQASGIGELAGTGWIDLDNRTHSFEVHSTNFQLESLKVPEAGTILGSVELKAESQGAIDNPEGKASLTFDSPAVGKIAASADVKNHELSFQSESQGLRLDDVGLRGTASFTANGHVPWGQWQRVDVRVMIPELDLFIAQHEIKNREPLDFAIRDGNLIVNRAEIESDQAKVSISGRLPIERPSATSQLTVMGDIPLDIAERYIPAELALDLEGNARLEGNVAGTLTDPQPQITVSTAGATATSSKIKQPITDIAAKVLVARQDVTIETLDAKAAGGAIHLAGKLPFEEGTTTALLTIDKIDPAAFFFPPDRKVRSSMSARIEASAPKFEIDDVVANARITELSLTGSTGSTIQQTQETLISLKNGRLSLGQFEIAGKTTKLSAGGTFDLVGDQNLNFKVDGSFPADIFTRATADYGLGGPIQANAIVAGTMKSPHITGALTWAKGQAYSNEPPIAADNVTASITFDGPSINIAKLEGNLNGGTISLRGKFRVVSGGITEADLTLRGRSVFLDYPKGLQTASNLNLTLKNEGRNIVLGGRTAILDGAYREGIDLTLLLRAMQRQVSLISEPSPILNNLRLNVEIVTRQPVVLDNNLGRLETDANLRLVGSLQRPGLTGRLEIQEDGRIYFGGRTFAITNGVIDFTDETRIAPRFNLSADTIVSDYNVTLKMTGDVGDITTSFSSEPSANEDQIMALLFTGSISNAGKGGAYAQTQLLTLFGSGLTGGLSTKLRNTFGLSEFRIDPGLISADSDPTARLTIGQSLTPEFRLTYSSNLADSNDQIWSAEYNWRRRFLARYFRQTDQSNRMEFRQRIRFGGGPLTGDFSNRTKRPVQRINNIEITGTPVFDEKTILKQLKLKVGGKYNFLKTQDRIEKLEENYAKKGYAEARVHQERNVEGETRRQRRRQLQPQDPDVELPEQKLNLTFDIDAGEPVKFVFEGTSLSRSARNRVLKIWRQGIIDQQRTRTAVTEIRRSLQRDGYADAQVKSEVKLAEDLKTVIFEIDRGQKYDRPIFNFPEASKELTEELREALRKQRLDVEVKGNPDAVSTFLQKYLLQQGYLTAKVGKPEITVVDDDKLMANVSLGAMRKFKLGNISFEGRRSLEEKDLRNAIVYEPGDDYVPEDRYTIASRVQQAYWNSGYRQAEVDVEEKANAAAGAADIVVKIDEKQKYEISAIDIKGLVETNEAFVRRRLEVTEGDVLSAKKINDSRKNLLDSGAYNLLDFTYPSIGSPASPSAPQPVELDIKLREPKPFRFDYGITFDTERGPGFIADFSTINTLGEARVLGLRTIVDRQRQEYRLYFTQPFLGKKKINTTGTLYSTNDIIEGFDNLRTHEYGLTAQQFVRFGPKFTFSYGYKFGFVNSVYEPLQLQYKGRIAPLTSTLSRDTRDNVLDATTGSFISNAFEYAPSVLGGNINYYRYYVQAFKYFGLTKPATLPFEGDRKRSRIALATGGRFGFADTFKEEQFLPVDRFFAGGGTTVRGYAQNTLGPQLPDGTPIGGRATLIFNNELRFPVYKWLYGVGFLDAGNVWERPGQFSFADLRAGTGFGLRIRNPFILIRLDYGFKIARRPGESMGAFFFSIGQAF